MDNHVHTLHAGVENDEVNFVCGKCNHKFFKEDDFDVHVQIHDQPKVTQTVSDLLLNDTDENAVPENLEEGINEEVFKCTHCNFSFQELMDLNSHMGIMHSNQVGPRTENTESTDDKVTKRVVVDVEEQPKQGETMMEPEVTCPFCKLLSKNLDTLKMHIENVHTMPDAASSNNSIEKITIEGNETCIECPHCDYIGTKTDIETHIPKKHGIVAFFIFIFIC